jgi:hypothetical protein
VHKDALLGGGMSEVVKAVDLTRAETNNKFQALRGGGYSFTVSRTAPTLKPGGSSPARAPISSD